MSSVLPPKLGENDYSNIFTASVNLCGLPAISIPAGFVSGLPVGVQLIGDKFEELKLLNAALAFERSLSFGGEENEI